MFDFAQITGWIKDLAGQNTDVVGNAVQQFSDAGISADLLQNTDVSQLSGLLTEHGIDPSQFDASQMSEIVQQFGIELPPGWSPTDVTDKAA